MRITFAALLVGAFALCSPAGAQSVTHVAAQVESGDYSIEPDHTIVLFTLSHLSISTYSGRFSGVSGHMTLDAHNPAAARVSISVPTASISTTSLTLNHDLAGNGWLDCGTYPAATFVSRTVRPTGTADAEIDGTFTLHGVAKPLTLHAHFVGAGIDPITGAYTVGFDLTGTLHRSDFGVTKYGTLVGDQVTLSIEAAFVRH